MNGVLSRVRAAVGERNLCQSLSRDECGVDPTGLPAQRVIVDADLAFLAHKWSGTRCDFIMFYAEAHQDHVITVPLELKSGRAEVAHYRTSSSRVPISLIASLLPMPPVNPY